MSDASVKFLYVSLTAFVHDVYFGLVKVTSVNFVIQKAT